MTPARVIEQFLRGNVSPSATDHLLCGVSGGLDSMALLDALVKSRKEYGFDLTALHVNYGLESHADRAEQVVRGWCDQQGIDFVACSSLFSRSDSTQRQGEEGFLREQRYRFFETSVRLLEASGLFLAHHADDQAETLLQRIGRGTGLYGLQGMEPVSHQRSFPIFRPFLSVPKQSLKEYVDGKNIPCVTDPSNQKPDYLRNRIRHQLLPRWEEIQQDVRPALARLAKIARHENEFWEQYLDQNFQYRRWPDEIHVDRETFRAQPRAARARFLHRIPRMLSGDSGPGWSMDHLEELLDFFESNSGQYHHLPGSIRAVVEYERVAFYRASSLPSPPSPAQPSWTEDQLDLGRIGMLRRCKIESGNGKYTSEISRDRLDSCSIRGWKPGDRIQLDNRKRSLKEIFQDHRIPVRARDLWPVLVVEHKIHCLPGLAVSNGAAGEKSESISLVFSPSHPAFEPPASLS